MNHPFDENIIIGNIHIHVFNYRLLLYLNTSTLIAIDLFIYLFTHVLTIKWERKKERKNTRYFVKIIYIESFILLLLLTIYYFSIVSYIQLCMWYIHYYIFSNGFWNFGS